MLDPAQARVAAHRSGALQVRGRPGFGATTALIEAVVGILSAPHAPAPDRVVVVAFGRRAAVQVRQRLARRLVESALPRVTTVHGLAFEIVARARAADDVLRGVGLRVLSGAEEDARLRDLLAGAVADGTVEWPPDLMAALPTVGLSNEVRAVLARLRTTTLTAEALRAAGAEHQRPEWQALADLAQIDADVMALEDVVDYPTLMDLAVREVEHHRVGLVQPRALIVDDAEELDALGVGLLRGLIGPDTAVIVAGDPDRSIFGFRGSDPRAYRALASPLAPEVITLSTPWRAPVPRAVAALVDRRLRRGAPMSSDADADADAHADASRWSVGVYDGPAEMAAHIAAHLRDLHVVHGLPWSTVAVLTRTPGDLHVLRRELEAAGVPTLVEVDDAPLAREAAVAALLDIVRAALDPASVDPARARDIVTGPLVGLDPFEVRQLARDGRAHWPMADRVVPGVPHAPGRYSGGPVPGGDEVLRSILIDPTPGVALPGDPAWDRVRRVHALLAEIQRQVSSGAAPMEVLWTAWTFDHSRWPERLRSAALAGQRRAAHDLDAVSALFETADRLTERYAGVLGVGGFVDALDAQRLPAERVAGRSSVDGVHLLTVHAAKGREWEHVIVTGAQEGRWPAPERSSVLGVDRLGVERLDAGAAAGVVARLHEDRRLMYTALTRARRHTHVAVVSSPTDTGEQPSRFVADLLGGDPTEFHAATAVAPTGVVVHRRLGRPTRAGTLAAWVADLRGVLADPHTTCEARADAAAALSWLREQRLADGTAVLPAADPARWWGLREPSSPPGSLSSGGDRARVSVSDVDALLTCPLQWFLRRVARSGSASPNASLGRVVHALADSMAGGDAPNDPQALQALVDQVWDAIGFDVAWQARAEREAARAMVERLCAYARGRDHALIATEIGFSVPIDVGDVGTVEVRGRMDRVELDDAGVHIVDLKTGARAPSTRQVNEHRQLALYQLAAEHGALGDVVPADTTVAGASLVHVRIDGEAPGQPRVQVQQAAPEVLDNARADLARAARLLVAGDLVARPGAACATCDVRRLCPTPGPRR